MLLIAALFLGGSSPCWPMRDRGDYGELDIPACDPHAVPNLLHQIILGQILFVDIPAPTCQLNQFQYSLTMI